MGPITARLLKTGSEHAHTRRAFAELLRSYSSSSKQPPTLRPGSSSLAAIYESRFSCDEAFSTAW